MIYHKRVYNNIVKISVNINMLVRVLPDMLHTWPISLHRLLTLVPEIRHKYFDQSNHFLL